MSLDYSDKKRDVELDVLKAIGIICVVIGHSGSPLKQFVYLFHMAIFFIASGYFYRPANAASVYAAFQFIKKRIKGLWLPFFIGNTIFTLCNNLFIDMNIYTDNNHIHDYLTGALIGTTSRLNLQEILIQILQGIVLTSSSQLCGTYWFLTVLFHISIMYVIADFLIQKINARYRLLIQGILSGIFLTIGYFMSRNNMHLHDIEVALSLYCLFFLGECFGRRKDKTAQWTLKRWGMILAVSSGLLIVLTRLHIDIETNVNSYVNPFVLLVASVSGWAFLYSMSVYIDYFSQRTNQAIAHFLCVIGSHTLAIMTLHFLAFKMINLLIVKIYGFPDFCIAAFPVVPADAYNTGTDLWWVAYVIVGVGLPLIAGILWQRIKIFVRNKIIISTCI